MSSDENEFGSEFVTAYLNLMGDVWHSQEEEARLVQDPTAYASEKGLPVASGATVRLDRTQPEGLISAEEVIRDWTATPGVHILHVPAEEIVNAGQLTEAELEMIGAGDTYNINICLILIA
jgi:hypothetical protein